MDSILKRIHDSKIQEVAFGKKNWPLANMNDVDLLPIRNFVEALKIKRPAIIAEIKQASPSLGIIRTDFDVAAIASIYEKNAASCISVLTDVPFFKGSPNNINLAKSNCSLPILRKDFIIDSYQIHESRAIGADCILLIVALLDDSQLHDYCQLAESLDLSVLVESHTKEELERALRLPTPLMGVNNRSLDTFKTDLQCSIELKKYIPVEKILVSESGLHEASDIKRLQVHGINTFLIGESLMRAEDIGKKLRTFMGRH